MAFQTPKTVKEIVTSIHEKKYLLPSIQREFVWKQDQITMLFDSLLRDYPISSFLFWDVPKEKKDDFIFYEFLKDYHQVNAKHNPPASTNITYDIIAILDGQQRLTSLYIGLMGSYAEKLPYKRWDDLNAYPAKKLYLDLLNKPENIAMEFDFQFLTDDEAVRTQEHHWFLVGDILKFKEPFEVNEYLIEHSLSSHKDKEKAKFSNRALYALENVINRKPIISYYLEESDELDKVLNIFIRINSGGTILSYSDLLLSFATAQWTTRNAREEITDFVDKINQIGGGFKFDKDIVLKSSLVLCDFSDISFKVDNFNQNNMMIVESKWDEITDSIYIAVQLLSSFGFSRENLYANNILIPIAYFIKHFKLTKSFVTSTHQIGTRSMIKKWIVSSVLKRVFSFSPDGVILPIRKIIKDQTETYFPLEEITSYFKGTSRDLTFSEDDIGNLLWSKYGNRDIFYILSILCPWADLKHHFHIDHIFPKSSFTEKRLKERGISEDLIPQFVEKCNYLPNLQLLEEIPNIEKSDKDFGIWFENAVPDNSKSTYMSKHYIPDMDLGFETFLVFFEKREKLLLKTLKEILQ